MPARKFIALVAGILGIVAAFLPVAHGDGWITGFSLLRGNPWTLLPSMIAFVPSAVASSARTGRRSGARRPRTEALSNITSLCIRCVSM